MIEVVNKIQIPSLDLNIIRIQQQDGNGDSTSNDQSNQASSQFEPGDDDEPSQTGDENIDIDQNEISVPMQNK